MSGKKKGSASKKISLLFLIFPTFMLFFSYLIIPYPEIKLTTNIISVPMFCAPILLGIGYLIKKEDKKNTVKILGWMVFAFYWSTQPAKLYFSEGGDVFNAIVCIIGVYVLSYLAYHEWLSKIREENISCLNWIAGASAIAGIIYFGIEKTPLAHYLIEQTAIQSGLLLDVLIGNAEVHGSDIFLDARYAVTIIFACTAVQAMFIFVGMIGVLSKVNLKRKIYGLLITLIPIYILNLFRNAMVTFLIGKNITDFNIAHNYIAKAGALITLVVLLFVIIKLIPEIFDEINCLIDLYKRNGSIEQFLKNNFRKN
jgi:archaeosortase A (PGF-CTERM-specific)